MSLSLVCSGVVVTNKPIPPLLQRPAMTLPVQVMSSEYLLTLLDTDTLPNRSFYQMFPIGDMLQLIQLDSRQGYLGIIYMYRYDVYIYIY